jgi:branched-chain amino acid transport system substrate-binding protein
MLRLLCLLILFTASAWANPQEIQVSSTPTTLKIGVILPLSGGWASWGQRIREGIELSKDRFRNPIEFSFDDEGTCEAKKGILAARKFFFEDIKILVVGCVATIKALLPEAKKRGVVIFAAGLLDRESFNRGAMVVSLATQVGTEAIAQAKYIEGQSYKSVAFIRPQEAFGEELVSVLNAELNQRKIKVLFDDNDSFSTNDFTASILKIKRDKPEVIIINLGESQQLAFMKALRESGSTVPVLSTYGLESNSTSSENVKSLEGITYTYPFNSASESSNKLSFDRSFAQKFGEDKKPNANVYFVSDGLSFLDHALNKCAGTDTSCIFDHFIKLGSIEGLSGAVTFRNDGSTDRPYKIKRVVNGKFTWLK